MLLAGKWVHHREAQIALPSGGGAGDIEISLRNDFLPDGVLQFRVFAAGKTDDVGFRRAETVEALSLLDYLVKFPGVVVQRVNVLGEALFPITARLKKSLSAIIDLVHSSVRSDESVPGLFSSV